MSTSDEEFIRNYDEDSDMRYILEVTIDYPKDLHDLHKDLPFLPLRMKINKCNKFLCNLYDRKNYIAQVRILKQALDHGLVFKKLHKVVIFNQKAWLKSYTDMNTKLRTKAKNDFKKDFLK